MGTLLRGSCACGRNLYAITIPKDTQTSAAVLFDNSSHCRRLQATPLGAFLRVPLSWFQSSTIAFFPDETHQTIRRTFSSPTKENLRHQFCGYCGTQLSQWDDSSRSAEDSILLTLGSLLDEDLDLLDELGLLDATEAGNVTAAARESRGAQDSGAARQTEDIVLTKRGAPWFEDLVQDSALGTIRRQKGGQTSDDGSVRMQWEVLEWTSNDDDGGTGKRKLGDLDEGQDVEMTR